MIEIVLIRGPWLLTEQRMSRAQLQHTCRAFFGNLHHITDQIEKLLAICELIDQTFRHERKRTDSAFLNVFPGNRQQAIVLVGITQHDPIRPGFGKHTRDKTPLFRGDQDRFKTFVDDL